MPPSPPPTRSQLWLQQALVALASLVLLGSGYSLARRITDEPLAGNPWSDGFLTSADSLLFGAFALILFAVRLNRRSFGWLGIIPGFFTLLNLARNGFSLSLMGESTPTMVTGTLLLGSMALPCVAAHRLRRWRSPVLGLAGA